MRILKEFIGFVVRGIPLVAVIVLATLLAIHIADILPPIGVAIIFIAALIIASAAVGIAKDIIEGL